MSLILFMDETFNLHDVRIASTCHETECCPSGQNTLPVAFSSDKEMYIV